MVQRRELALSIHVDDGASVKCEALSAFRKRDRSRKMGALYKVNSAEGNQLGNVL